MLGKLQKSLDFNFLTEDPVEVDLLPDENSKVWKILPGWNCLHG